MCERFTDRARRRQQGARIDERVVEPAVRHSVVETVAEGSGPSPGGHIPFTPRAKKVLELSLREALQLGHPHIGTEHLLLGTIREGEGVAAQVLTKLGADLGTTRERVLQLLGPV